MALNTLAIPALPCPETCKCLLVSRLTSPVTTIAVWGSTFTTGANAGGYLLTSISFMQVANYNTYYSMNGLGSQGIRLFQMGNGITAGNPYNSNPTYFQSVSQILDSETIQYPTMTTGGNFFNSTPGAGAWWVTVTFGAPISLQANAQYGFDLQTDGTGANGDFFMEWNGTSTAGYSGGEAFVDGANGNSPDANITRIRVASPGIPVLFRRRERHICRGHASGT